MKIPFSVYDFFGYSAAGFLVLAAIDFSCNGGWLLKDTMAPVSRSLNLGTQSDDQPP